MTPSQQLTAPLTQQGGAFSGVAGKTLSFAQIAASAAAAQPSPIAGMSLATFTMIFGPPVKPAVSPFLAELPPLTPPMASPIGSLSQYCPGYPWAAKLVEALASILPGNIVIPAGDDSATPGNIPENTPAAQLPGIYTPVTAPSGGGFEITVGGVKYENLCVRFQVTPATGAPYVVGGIGPEEAGAFNATLIVREFLAEPNNVNGVLQGLLHQIATGGPTLPL